MPQVIRSAVEEDLPQIVGIYNVAVSSSLAVFTEELTTVEERRVWLQQRSSLGYPVFVAEVEGQIAGFASFADFRPWPGYRHTVEHSVYVSPAHQGRGHGKMLMRRLFAEARDLGKRVMVAGIEAGNVSSLRFHELLGFERAGTLKEVGYKFGRTLDLTFLCKRLAPEPETSTLADSPRH